MIETSPTHLIDIIEFIGILFSAVMLLIGVITYFKNTRIRQAESIATLFENFQRDRQAALDNPKSLKILAEEREISEEDVIKSSMGSFGINQAYLLFFYHKKKLITKDRWENDLQDMRVLFQGKLVSEQWFKVRNRFTGEFQSFIDHTILIDNND